MALKDKRAPKNAPVADRDPLAVTEPPAKRGGRAGQTGRPVGRAPLGENLNGFERFMLSLKPKMPVREAFYALLLCAVYADGRADPEELREVVALSHRTKTLRSLRTPQLERARLRFEPMLKSPEALEKLAFEACRSIPPKMGLSLFAHCCDIIFADQIVAPAEKEFLAMLVKRFALSETAAQDMALALRAKNAA
ncbi:MAG: TerB family tellurite resistance protein [Caulobacterales bacterium]|jgi:hypothetical protein